MIWSVKLHYARLYNYRYAKIQPEILNNPSWSNYRQLHAAYLDTGHIATYTNLLGFFVTRKIWNCINLQSGLSLSRRGFLGSYVEYSDHNAIFIIPRKAVFIPIILNYNFHVGKKLMLEFGLGYEKLIKVGKEYYNPNRTLGEHSKGFWGYDWTSSRKLFSGTIIEPHYSKFSSSNIIFTIGIGYILTRKITLLAGGNYLLAFTYKNSSGYLEGGVSSRNLGYLYKSKSYIFNFGTTLSYAF